MLVALVSIFNNCIIYYLYTPPIYEFIFITPLLPNLYVLFPKHVNHTNTYIHTHTQIQASLFSKQHLLCLSCLGTHLENSTLEQNSLFLSTSTYYGNAALYHLTSRKTFIWRAYFKQINHIFHWWLFYIYIQSALYSHIH